MIPRRLRLSGFMCYGPEEIISFRGSSIWALFGENGSGKSTLFDAMYYALFGLHRQGSQKAQQLIHHRADGLLVEFDFALGEVEYRVRRTLSRKSRTVQAFVLPSTDMPETQHVHVHPLPETSRESGFDDWVREVLGLDSKTFIFSVLLQQGKSDALIKASASERHQMLTQIIDLSVYDQLRQRAENYHKQYDADAKSDARNLMQLEQIDPRRLDALTTQIQQAGEGKLAARELQIQLAGWRVQALRWLEVTLEEQKVLHILASCEELLEQASQIERDAKRSVLLTEVLPLLQGIYEKQQSHEHMTRHLKELQRQQAQHLGLVTLVKERYQNLQREIDAQKTTIHDRQEKVHANQQCLDELEPMIQELNVLENGQRQIQVLKQQLDAIDPNVSDMYQHVQQELRGIELLASALPRLQQFVTAREQWHQDTEALTALTQQEQHLDMRLRQWRCDREGLLIQIEELKEQEGNVQQDVTRFETVLKQQEQRESNFRSIDGQATCRYCGQSLTAEHLERERIQILQELTHTQEGLHEAQKQLTDVRQQRKQQLQKSQKLQNDVQEMERNQKKLQERCRQLTGQKQRAEMQAESALHGLPSYIQAMQETETESINLFACLQATFPTPKDLALFTQQVQRKEILLSQERHLQSSLDRRQHLCSQLDYVRQQMGPYEQSYPPTRQSSLRQAYQQAQQDRLDVRDQLDTLNQRLTEQEQDKHDQEERLRVIESTLSSLAQQIAVAQRDFEHEEKLLEERLAALPADWHLPVADLHSKALEEWKQELEALRDAPAQKRRLVAALSEQQSHLQRITELTEIKTGIPTAAQRPVNEIDAEAFQTAQKYESYEQQEREAQREKVRLEGICEQCRRWQQQYEEAKQKASLYKELSKLLGADYLQRYLLQKAEQGIVNAANEFLDRISAGTLRLELASAADRGSKALDLVAYHQRISEISAQPVAFLSGSQQFRVAVSLALGIGKYAGGANRKLESVIIDEGFGSLDQKGRRDMIQVIYDLKDVLKCIIVVSHQQEFFEEFENKYHVTLVNGYSQIALV